MVANDAITRERNVALIDSLPDEALGEVVSFLELQRAKDVRPRPAAPPYRPTPMGGLWKGVEVTAADIAEARREMWMRLAEDDASARLSNGVAVELSDRLDR